MARRKTIKFSDIIYQKYLDRYTKHPECLAIAQEKPPTKKKITRPSFLPQKQISQSNKFCDKDCIFCDPDLSNGKFVYCLYEHRKLIDIKGIFSVHTAMKPFKTHNTVEEIITNIRVLKGTRCFHKCTSWEQFKRDRLRKTGLSKCKAARGFKE